MQRSVHKGQMEADGLHSSLAKVAAQHPDLHDLCLARNGLSQLHGVAALAKLPLRILDLSANAFATLEQVRARCLPQGTQALPSGTHS